MSTGSSDREIADSEHIDGADSFDPQLVQRMQGMTASRPDTESALSLLAGLVPEAEHASKEKLDRIKVMDKVLNSYRYMMEAKLKMDEALAIAKRLDRMEARLEEIAALRDR